MKNKKESLEINNIIIVLLGIFVLLIIFNQWQISGINNSFTSGVEKLSPNQIYDIKSTSQSVATLFPVDQIKNDQDAINMMISQGTPDYGKSMGISFDDPVGALDLLSKNYNTIKNDVKKNNPEVWKRYLNLATKPVGISCEFCCGVGPIGITKKGDLTCGCSHNPAMQSITLLLMKDTNMNDAEVLKEALKWKSLWFPKDMVNLALKASGGEIDAGKLPGMVGGC